MLSKGAKRTIIDHITVIMQYFWEKRLHGVEICTIMHKDDSGIFSVSASQTLRYKISLFECLLLKLYRSVCGNQKFLNKYNIDVLFILMSALLAIVNCQKYFGNHMISSKIQLIAPLLNTRRCTL